MSPPLVSVIVCTHNPRSDYFARALDGLRRQTLSATRWELIVVDNESTPPVDLVGATWHPAVRLLREEKLGLTPARLRGITESRSPLLIFVDDDNVLAPDYLAVALRLFEENAELGAAGGPVVPEWESEPAPWTREFHGLLALRDLGPRPLVCRGRVGAAWPDFAPLGAGLVVRRSRAVAYADAAGRDSLRQSLDRAGGSLDSGGDNDLIFTVLHSGGSLAYFPELRVTHLIAARRVTPAYLARLNAGIMRTWVLVLHIHGQCPWPAVRPWTVPLRCARAWIRTRAWQSPAHRIRWQGRCGQFRGQAEIEM